MAPCYEKKKIKIKKEGKEEINATYGVIVRVIAFTFQLQLFASTFFQLVTIEFFPSKKERDIYFFHYELARFEATHDLQERKREGKMRKRDCYRDEIICEFPRCTDSRVLSPFEEPSPFVGVHLDGRKWTGTKGEAV